MISSCFFIAAFLAQSTTVPARLVDTNCHLLYHHQVFDQSSRPATTFFHLLQCLYFFVLSSLYVVLLLVHLFLFVTGVYVI